MNGLMHNALPVPVTLARMVDLMMLKFSPTFIVASVFIQSQ